MNQVEITIRTGRESDKKLMALVDAADPWPFRADGIVWPLALITGWRTRWGMTIYTIVQVEYIK